MTVPCPATHPRCQHTRCADYRNYGCRCAAARQDRERHRKQAHLRPPCLIDGTGARRRLQALMAIGHSQNDLNEALGRRRGGSLGPLLWGPGPRPVTVELDQRIRRVYDQLWDQPGPGPRAALIASRAAARGWPPPLWWDDDLIDDPTYDGLAAYAAYLATTQRPTRPTRKREFEELVDELTRKGWTAPRIAEHTSRPIRAVERARAALRARHEHPAAA